MLSTTFHFHSSTSRLSYNYLATSYVGRKKMVVIKFSKEVDDVIPMNPSPAERATKQIELRTFDETRAGVKGLFDAGVEKLPGIFVHGGGNERSSSRCGNDKFQCGIPVIDIGDRQEEETVEKLLEACERWGFFQVVNHGIPTRVMEEMLEGIRRFHEQDVEMKMPFYTRDLTKNVVYNSNYDLYESKAAQWKDTITFKMAPFLPQPHQLPPICRYYYISPYKCNNYFIILSPF